jgi:hypothetical protein
VTRPLIAWVRPQRAALFGWASVAILCLEFAAIIVVQPTEGRRLSLAPIAFGLTTTIVGALIVGRQPRNLLGWLFCVVPVLLGFGASDGGIAAEYVRYGVVTAPGSLPRPDLVAWLGGVAATIGFPSFGLALVLFPSGRPRARVERALVLAFAVMIGLNVASVFGVPELEPVSGVRLANPFAIAPIVAAYGGLQSVVGILFIGFAIAALANLGRRFRQSTGVERQQFEWFFVGAAITTLGNLAFGLLSASGHGDTAISIGLFPIATSAIPISIGIAVLRHRLYDIDLVINRALVYGATTAAIAIAFFGGIGLIQAVLRPITSGSELAVAASTLASVALFQPLRRRIQEAVDRRFYRSRYDAARTLDAFSAHLRDQVALDAVRAGLLDAVRDTVQPAHASVWLRR